jgi:hypothetical protein
MKSDEWAHFARKVDMLVEELEAYSEVQSAYEQLESFYAQNIKKQSDLKKDLQEVIQSNKTSFGFFSKVTKEDKLTELRGKLAKVEAEIYVQEKLVAVISKVILRHEIPVIKSRKRERFDEIIEEFAVARIRKLEQELTFWNKVVEKNEQVEYSSEIMQRHLQQNNESNTYQDHKIKK